MKTNEAQTSPKTIDRILREFPWLWAVYDTWSPLHVITIMQANNPCQDEPPPSSLSADPNDRGEWWVHFKYHSDVERVTQIGIGRVASTMAEVAYNALNEINLRVKTQSELLHIIYAQKNMGTFMIYRAPKGRTLHEHLVLYKFL